jgi:DUF4097 and DUF4098 domain-containing protein YvlB
MKTTTRSVEGGDVLRSIGRWCAAGLTALMLLPFAPGTSDEALAKQGSERGRRQGEPFHWSGRLSSGKRVRVQGINGAIEAERSGNRQVVVEAERTADRSDPEDVEIEVSEDDKGIVVCARYPRPDGRLNDCDGKQNVRNNDVRVHFRVRVPAGVDVELETVNGDVDATDLASRVEAATVNGSVRISTTEICEAATVNGSIVARLGNPDLDGGIDFCTVNGDIRLELDADVDAEVRGHTMNGSISTDFPLMVRGRFGKRIEGSIGRGGPNLGLETINGNIRLRSI